MTQVVSRATVPEVVMVPPVKPVPAVIEVTVPDPPPPPVAVMVTAPVAADSEIPEPARREATPVLLTTTLPVVGVTLIPAPDPVT